MQTRHRRMHYTLWWLVGPLLLVGAIAGLALRRPLPVQPPPAARTTSADKAAAAQIVENER